MIILKKNLQNRNVSIVGGTDEPKELVAVDLTVGSRYRVPGKSEWFELRGQHLLRPGRCVLIQTQEKLQLPANIFASIFSRGSLSAKGLVVSNTKVDPLFSGTLNIPVFNAGKQSIKLEYGARFCCIVFHLLEQPVPENSKREPIDMGSREQSLFIDLFIEYLPHLITGLLSLLAAVAGTYITLKYTQPSQPVQPPQLEQQGGTRK
jgi:dUTPase